MEKITIIINNYTKNDGESNKLISQKESFELTKDSSIKTLKPCDKFNFYFLLAYLIKTSNISNIFLDYPFSYKNIIFLIVIYLKNLLRFQKIRTFISIRGNLLMKRSKKYYKKKIYWKFFSLILDFTNTKLIASSSFEANQLSQIIKNKCKRNIVIIPDIIFHKKYFSKTYAKYNSHLDSNLIRFNKNKLNNEIKIILPSRISEEKGITQLISLLSQETFSDITFKTKFVFSFCSSKEKIAKDLYISTKNIEVNYLGWLSQEDLLNEFQKHDVALIPSLYESFSVAAFQSLLMNCSLLITSNSLWREIEKKNLGLPIKTCPPLLEKINLEELLLYIYNLYQCKTQTPYLTKLKKIILEEAKN